jgi:hypothetical protein
VKVIVSGLLADPATAEGPTATGDTLAELAAEHLHSVLAVSQVSPDWSGDAIQQNTLRVQDMECSNAATFHKQLVWSAVVCDEYLFC